MPSRPLRLIVCGAAGRMGSRVARLAAEDRRFRLTARVFHQTTAEVFSACLPQTDVIVDFSAPAASVGFAAAAARARKALVIGTTGLSSAQQARLRSCARRIPVLLSPNFSPAVNLMLRLCAQAARLLPRFEASISEIHHARKKDAPSGTALKIAEAVKRGRGAAQPVPTVSQRLGDIVGEHTLTLAGPFERLELTHRAHSRAVFASGALAGALWIYRKKPGLYGMDDWLAER